MKTKEKVILQPSLYDNNPISLLDDEKNILFNFLSISHFPISLLKLEYPSYTDCILKHQHTRIEILIIDEGSLEVVTNSNRFIAQEGDIVVINSGAIHEGKTLDEPVKYRVIMFELSFLENHYQMEDILRPFQTNALLFVEVIRDVSILEMCNRIFDAAGIQSEFVLLSVTGLIYQLLYELIHLYAYSVKEIACADNEFSRVLVFISGNYCNNITSSSISKTFGYSQAYFCRLFKSITGLTVSKYIQDLRLQKAKELLQKTQHSISYISSEIGYNNPVYFSKCFRERYNMTPIQYRQKHILIKP